MTRLFLQGILGVFFITGCVTVGPDYETPEINLPKKISLLASTDDVYKLQPVDSDWWSRFNDPLLTDLIERASKYNTEVEASIFRIQQARANLAAINARGLPAIAFGGNGQRVSSSELAGGFGPPPGAPATQNLFGLDITVGWEIDLFGRLSRSSEAAAARVDLSEAEYRGLRLSVQASTAETYFRLNGIQNQIFNLQQSLEISKKTLKLIDQLRQNGLASEEDLIKAQQEVSSIKTAEINLLKVERQVASQIASLVGERPDILFPELLNKRKNLPLPGPVPVGLPSELLERRPDIVIAERNLAAATAQIGIATANFFPSLSLTGNVGSLSDEAGNIFDSLARTAGIGLFVDMPIFDGGARSAAYTQAKAEAQIALIKYRGSVINAFSDIEASTSAYAYGHDELTLIKKELSQKNQLATLKQTRYEHGLDDLLAVYASRRSFLMTEAELISTKTEILSAYASIFLSLGGGWREDQ